MFKHGLVLCACVAAAAAATWAADTMPATGAAPSNEQVRQWVAQLIADKPKTAGAAISNLRACPPDLSVPALVDATRDKDSRLRVAAAKFLVEIRDKRAIPAVVRLLADPVIYVRQQALDLLGKSLDKSQVAAAKEIFDAVPPATQAKYLGHALAVDNAGAGPGRHLPPEQGRR